MMLMHDARRGFYTLQCSLVTAIHGNLYLLRKDYIALETHGFQVSTIAQIHKVWLSP